jgi:Transposase family tnp2
MTAMFLLSLRYLYNISKSSISNLLAAMRHNLPVYGVSQSTIDDMAKHPATYEKVMNLEPVEEQFAVCQACGSLYPIGSEGLPTVSHCTFQQGASLPCCGTPLCETNGLATTPVTILRRQRLDDWISQLLSRPGVVEKIDTAWDPLKHPPQNTRSDFWDGSFVRSMKGPDNNPVHMFAKDESRLLFSLSVDWFNPYHNKIAGKVASTGVIVMSCLNLPISERYNDENVYVVGLLPGRQQQSNVNAVLEPLVEDLLRYWDAGVYYVGIPSTPEARLIRCALVQLICDLPAARKVAGFPHYTSTHGCSVCLTPKNRMSDVNSFMDSLLQRDGRVHLIHAKAYKRVLDQEGLETAEKTLKNNAQGVRWSVLNRLPYWDPVRCTVLDVMHLVLLGMCQYHWRVFWNADQLAKSKPNQKQSKHREEPDPGYEGEGDDIESDADLISVGGDALSEPCLVNNAEPPQLIKGTVRIGGTLAAAAMNKARACWIGRNEKALGNLNTDQILCLLRENHGEIPSVYQVKSDLAQILVVSLTQWDDLR